MSPHRRTEQELDQAQREAELSALEAARVMQEVEEAKPDVLNLITALKKRRIENHFGRDYEVTMRPRTV